jgi:hypothetical protein
MSQVKHTRGIWAGLALIGVASLFCGRSADAADTPDFQEVRKLVLEHLKGVNENDLNRAAVEGLLNAFYPRIALVTNQLDQALDAASGAIAKTVVFERAYGYVRLTSVPAGLARALGSTISELESKQKLAGLILDLRFADGFDFRESAAIADLFLETEQPLLKWTGTSLSSTTKTNAIGLPVTVLVNRQTTGAAEALAGVLQWTGVSLTIGSPTAGQARVYREFPLNNGQKIRVASQTVELGDGTALTDTGLTPDLVVTVDADVERAHLEDPFATKGESAGTAALGADGIAGSEASGRERRCLNESELIRMRGETLGTGPKEPEEKQAPLITDPSLARALDFLKGWAALKRQR